MFLVTQRNFRGRRISSEPRISRSVDGKIGWFSKGRTTRFFVGIVLVFSNLSDIFDAEDFLFQLGERGPVIPQ